ncbi:MAG: hypothetical protein WCT44_00540 [Candidatus Paceibacterota bacterium]
MKKIIWTALVVACVVVGAYVYFYNNQEEGISKLDAGDTTNWETYLNDKYKFKFKYPSDYLINDFINNQFHDDEKSKTLFNLGAEDIYTMEVADGACGSHSTQISQNQKQILDKKQTGDNFDDGFALSDSDTHHYSKIFISDYGVKFAYGISLCQGSLEENEPWTIQAYEALLFNGDNEISFYFPIQNSVSADQGELYEIANQISQNKYNGKEQQSYNNYLKILSTLSFTQ